MSLFSKNMPGDTQKCVKVDIPFNLSLNDCLACSGCITDGEIGILSTDLSFVTDSTTKTSFVISPQSKINIFNIYRAEGMTYRIFEVLLSIFLKSNFSIFRIIDTSHMRTKIYEEIHKEYLDGKHLIISACPGTVMYIEKTAPHLIKYLSRVKSPQQMSFSLVRGSRTVSVMPCYDKRFENGRDGVNFDHSLTTKDFHKVLDDLGFGIFVDTYHKKIHEKSIPSPEIDKRYEERIVKLIEKVGLGNDLEIDTWETTQWNIGSSSGGYAEFIASKSEGFVVNKVKKGVEEYRLAENEVISQITGVENLINYFKSSKVKGPIYKMTEIFICRNSCIGGPGQVRTNDIEMDIEVYDKVGKEQPHVLYSEADLESKREFTKIETKKVNFKVDW